MKKVLILSLAYYPKHIGGAEVAIKEKTDRITDIEFHMITNRYDSTLPRVEKIGNVLVHRIGITRKNPSMADLRKWPLHLNKIVYQFLAAWYAIRLHHTYRYDAVWAMMAHSCGVPAAIFKLFYPKVPYVLELQEGDPTEYIEAKMRPLWLFFERAFTSADQLSVISTFLGNWGKRRGFRNNPVLVPNAVNTKHFSQVFPKEVLDSARAKFSVTPGDVCLITTSRLVQKNASDDVIRALPDAPKNVHFIIYGTGPDEGMLKALALKCGVTERVHFLGHIQHADLPAALQAADIFIRPSRSEGMGNSFVEAMAAGLPVIATQEGGIADFLFDAKRNPDKPTTGWAVDKDSPKQIAQAILDIVENPEKVLQVKKTARDMVVKKYDWDLVAKDMREKVFANLL